MENLIERLRKIEALADRGTNGERENARRMLSDLCEKYGVTLEQLTEETKALYSFSARGDFERKLFFQVAAHVLQSRKIRNRKTKTGILAELTLPQSIAIRECWDHYRSAWHDQLGDFFVAFVHKNNVFCPKEEGIPDVVGASADRKVRIFDLMRGMHSAPFAVRITEESALRKTE